MYRPKVNQIEYLGEKPVIKGKIVLLGKCKYKSPICVSKTEEIKENDWVYHRYRKQLFEVGGFGECNGNKAFNPLNFFGLPTDKWKLVKDCDKVLALSGNFTEQMVINKYEVYLECEKKHVNHYGAYGVEFKIKHDKHNNIILYTLKEKTKNKPNYRELQQYKDWIKEYNRQEGTFFDFRKGKELELTVKITDQELANAVLLSESGNQEEKGLIPGMDVVNIRFRDLERKDKIISFLKNQLREMEHTN